MALSATSATVDGDRGYWDTPWKLKRGDPQMHVCDVAWFGWVSGVHKRVLCHVYSGLAIRY